MPWFFVPVLVHVLVVVVQLVQVLRILVVAVLHHRRSSFRGLEQHETPPGHIGLVFEDVFRGVESPLRYG